MRAAPDANRARTILTALALFAFAMVVGGRDLARAPVYLYHDEAIYAVNAHSILTTGRDSLGLRLPLFLHTFAWIPPIAIYSRVLAFTMLPISEWSTRLPGVVFYAIDVLLTYLVGRRLFPRDSLAVLAGVFAMLTPAHLIHARLGTDHICGIPFFIGYVWFVLDFIERRREKSIAGAMLCLGLGIYGYNGAMTVTPVYFALTVGMMFFVLEIRTLRPYVAACVGLGLSTLPLIAQLAMHPEQPADQLRSYAVSGGARSTSVSGAAAGLLSTLAGRLDTYYNFFDPSLLFFRGDQAMLDSTREVGVFLLPILLLLPAGAYYILRHRRTVPDLFVLAGVAAAPIGALIVNEVKASRALVIVPLAALVAARGVEALNRTRSAVGRGVVVALLAGLVVHFQVFYSDYVGNYRERSSTWFEGNRDGAFESLVARADQTRAPALYVSSEILLVNYSWQFYMLKHGRQDLKDRLRSFDRNFDANAAPSGSLFLSAFDPSQPNVLDRTPAVRRVAVIENADRHPAFAVYEK